MAEVAAPKPRRGRPAGTGKGTPTGTIPEKVSHPVSSLRLEMQMALRSVALDPLAPAPARVAAASEVLRYLEKHPEADNPGKINDLAGLTREQVDRALAALPEEEPDPFG
jgi:hypothetical protein